MSEIVQVVGEDGEVYEVMSGDVMGDVMGDFEVVGAARRAARRAQRSPTGGLVAVNKPGWRRTTAAPGVVAPDQGLLPLPLSGAGGTNTFTAAINQIIFQGQVQKPFRPERLLVSVVRTGASATGRLIGQIFAGTDLQQADIQGLDLELLGNVQGFGIRMTMTPIQPGVFLRIVTNLSTPLAAADTIFASVQVLGRIVH
jgi:hypothetical protein